MLEASEVNDTLEFTHERIVRDYRIAYRSRQASLLGRREVLTGKAKFGIFGDGKEVPQLAMARAFRKGDVRSGYYRDQTFMMALGILTVEEFFAQLYADPSEERDPSSGGRQMNAHFATRMLAPDGSWLSQTESYNSSADMSPVSGQMPRLVGLAFASRLYREIPELGSFEKFSHHGDEIAFGTIGNASCAEGLFWESVNAVGVLKAPMLLSIWDDDYGISVPNEYQVTKSNLSELLSGFGRRPGEQGGYDLYRVNGWDYAALCETYVNAAEIVRREHVPAIVHVVELTQPQGHSTSGSHERYKSPERLAWEQEHDCITRMRAWMLDQKIASEEELGAAEEEERKAVVDAKNRAWEAFRGPLQKDRATVLALLGDLARAEAKVSPVEARLKSQPQALRRDLAAAVEDALIAARDADPASRQALIEWRRAQDDLNRERYDSNLYSEGADSALAVEPNPVQYGEDSPTVNGFEVVNACFDAALGRYPNLIAFGEDVGKLGDVNQGFSGLQEKYGELRVFDTGIREVTILGQAIGMAIRGLRPIAEMQYLDYLIFALQTMSDDLATIRFRSKGGQKAPVIVRTRGHRLEGIWHSGSLMAGILNLVHGMHVCVPRDMTRAAGFYNTLLAAEEPALVVEVLNGYRVKERLPKNIGEFRLALGEPEVLREGSDVTLVTYGACCRIAAEAVELLSGVGIEVELIDVQTLLPFDRSGRIVESLKKTNRIIFLDEDVPGGTTAYMMQNVIERDGGYHWLDSEPRTVPGKEHRPAYGSDGDYFSKPNRETIFEAVYELMHEAEPKRFPLFYR
ncbi:MAG TPA: thiamine pyrophosphate-dependent enzyme [Thermoanaerobaculia bacterium]|nr:thiamine pyrophosphate-dependent enzyme [Thermoanaerobaculia bacterium]